MVHSPPPHTHTEIRELCSETCFKLRGRLDFTDGHRASSYVKRPAQGKASRSRLINDGSCDYVLPLRKAQKPPNTWPGHSHRGGPTPPSRPR